MHAEKFLLPPDGHPAPNAQREGIRCPHDGLTANCSGPEVGFGEIAIDVREARFWTANEALTDVRITSRIADNPGVDRFG